MSPGMRFLASVLAVCSLCMASPARAGSLSPPSDEDSPRWCTTCHQDARFRPEGIGRSAHGDLACRDCHAGYQFDPHQAVAEPPVAGTAGLEDGRHGDPTALAACGGDCHQDAVDEVRGSKHGAALFGEHDARAPYCLECHGDPHLIVRSKSLSPTEKRAQMTARCAACHGDAKRVYPDGRSGPLVVAAYDASIHGRKLALGSTKAPGCADCHGGHAQPDLKDARAAATACGQCHTSATPRLAATFVHAGVGPDGDRVAYYTRKAFSWLVFLVVLALAAHVALDLSSTIRRRRLAPPPRRFPPGAPASVRRFDGHQRLQHGLLAASFTLLVLTGFPLSAHKLGAFTPLLRLFGGADHCALVHRVAGVTLLLVGAYHVAYLVVMARRRQLHWRAMLPSWRDARDVARNVAHFLDPRRPRPRFGRYSYFEKLDYFAEYWGTLAMGASGLMMMLPGLASLVLPSWAWSIARVVHTYEAMLAFLAIFVFHMYNVHLRPSVFPMSRVFLTGEMPLEMFEEEHGGEYDEKVARGELPPEEK